MVIDRVVFVKDSLVMIAADGAIKWELMFSMAAVFAALMAGSIFDVSPTLRLQRLPLIGFLFKHEPTIFPEEVRFGDIVAGLPLPDGIADGIYASHVLEHLCYDDFWIALRNTHRLLKPGGIFRLVVPDLEMRARKYLSQLDNGIADSNTWFMDTSNLGNRRRGRGAVALARSLFGNSAHLWMWDEKSIRAALEKSGFVNVR